MKVKYAYTYSPLLFHYFINILHRLISEKRFDGLFPGADPMLLDLIPYTHSK